MRVVEVGQYLVTKGHWQLKTISFRLLVANTLFLDTIPASQAKGWIQGKYENLDLYWKSRPVFSTSNMELKFEFGL